MRRISQERLAADSGIDRAHISLVEGEKTNASMDMLDKLAKGLGVAHAELLRAPRVGEARPKPLRVGRKAKAEQTSRAS